jgi:hypothetical protein
MDEKDTEFWYGLVFGFGMVTLITVVLVVILIQVGAFTRARIARREEAKDLELIKKYETLAEETRNASSEARSELTVIRERLVAIERLLREVE